MESDSSQQLKKESNEIRAAVAAVILTWSELEMALVTLLEAILSRSGQISEVNLASAIFYAPESTAARIAIVDRAFDSWARTTGDANEILDLWANTKKRIDRNKTTRNAAAHGQIISIPIKGTRRYRLVPPLFSPKFQDTVRKKKPMGRSANDLCNTTISIANIQRTIDTFRHLVQNYFAGDERAYAQNIRALQDAKKKRSLSGNRGRQSPEGN